MRMPLPNDRASSRGEANAYGWSDSALSRAVRSGKVERLRRGFFAARPATEFAHIEAAVRACSAAVASHGSVALLRDLPLLGASPPLPAVTVPPDVGVQLTGAHLHRATLEPADVTIHRGLATTTVARTAVDLGRQHGTRAMVVFADAALHADLIELADLENVVKRCSNWPGIRSASRGLSLVDGLAESPLETLSRLAIGQMPVPQPELQVPIHSRLGVHVARVDFYWDEFGVVGEADGLTKYTDAHVLREEKRRQERLEQLGIVVVRWSWTDVTRRPDELHRRLMQAFELGRSRIRSGSVREWSVRLPAAASRAQKAS